MSSSGGWRIDFGAEGLVGEYCRVEEREKNGRGRRRRFVVEGPKNGRRRERRRGRYDADFARGVDYGRDSISEASIVGTNTRNQNGEREREKAGYH